MLAPVTTALLLFSGFSSFALGVLVVARNPYRRPHRAFGLLALNLSLWAVGVACVTLSQTEDSARFWVSATFVVASFLPATFYHFIGLFARPRFEGLRGLLAAFYVAGLVLALYAATPWYVSSVSVAPGQIPRVRFGPALHAYGVCVTLAMLFSAANLFNKLRQAEGVERRQIQHVILGVFLSTLLATLTNIIAPILGITSLEPYGATFTTLMMMIFAYAMVRYHLLDVWVIISRTTVYALITGFVVLTFFSMVSIVHLTLKARGGATELLPTILTALVIALVLQPMKERTQLFLDRLIVKRRYDVQGLLARVSQYAAQMVKLHELLRTVAADIQRTMGVTVLRILLVDEQEPTSVVTEHSSESGEIGCLRREYEPLLERLRSDPAPLVLEQLVHGRPSRDRARLAEQLAELDAYVCLPLQTTAGLIGLLTLGQKTSRDMYSRDDLLVFTALAGPLATSIENARLYRKLEEANLHRARILSNMRGGVIAVDISGKVSTVNQGAIDLFGPVRLGQPLDALNADVAHILDHTLRTEQVVTDFETIVVRPDGAKVPVVISSSCLTTRDEQLTGAMAVVYDLTQVKRLEQNVQRADRLLSLGTLAAGMAHEIKNPLVSIKTFTQLLLNRYEDAEFRSTFAEIIPHEVERIDSIVTRLLHFARPQPAAFAPQNLRVIIEEVLALVENQVRTGHVTVETEFPDHVIEVYGDEQQLHQAFLNLCLNAIDALRLKQGGFLRINAQYDRMYVRRNGYKPRLEIECVKITISDTGCGISEDNLRHIFTPFFTTKENGSGLGLSVVHSIVAEHGGEIDVASLPDEGTTFTLRLPSAAGKRPVGVPNE